MITEKQLSRIINKKLQDTELFLVEVSIGRGNRITVYIDSDKYVSIDDCATLSRHIESELNRDVEDFELEVSSAGLDRPLKITRQYTKNIGNDLKITLHDNKIIVAALLGADEKEVHLLIPEDKKNKNPELELKLKYNEIKKAQVIIKFEKK
ncbi:MAG: ribosome assembly cofactor RimP [Bacteroidales bacterium]|jgi:ribosome maturation factor RimP|nr:ribosome assembly cofactor RimP [Bacteroidales bacterium]